MKATLKVLFTMTACMAASIAIGADIDGTWLVTIEAPTGTSKATLVLTQTGTDVTGHYAGQFGEAPVTGTTKGHEIELTYRVEMQGVPLEVNYIGTVEGAVFRGKVVVPGFGEGTFSGTKRN
jgi:hypothetical protein